MMDALQMSLLLTGLEEKLKKNGYGYTSFYMDDYGCSFSIADKRLTFSIWRNNGTERVYQQTLLYKYNYHEEMIADVEWHGYGDEEEYDMMASVAAPLVERFRDTIAEVVSLALDKAKSNPKINKAYRANNPSVRVKLTLGANSADVTLTLKGASRYDNVLHAKYFYDKSGSRKGIMKELEYLFDPLETLTETWRGAHGRLDQFVVFPNFYVFRDD